MGFNNTDLNPFQVTPITPPGKEHLIKLVQVSRTDTVASVKAMFPGGSSPYRIYISGTTASDAGTTAAVTVVISDNSGTISTGTADVLSAGVGATTAIVNMPGLPALTAIPNNGDYKVTVSYAETGTASTTGGPWKLSLEFIQ